MERDGEFLFKKCKKKNKTRRASISRRRRDRSSRLWAARSLQFNATEANRLAVSFSGLFLVFIYFFFKLPWFSFLFVSFVICVCFFFWKLTATDACWLAAEDAAANQKPSCTFEIESNGFRVCDGADRRGSCAFQKKTKAGRRLAVDVESDQSATEFPFPDGSQNRNEIEW